MDGLLYFCHVQTKEVGKMDFNEMNNQHSSKAGSNRDKKSYAKKEALKRELENASSFKLVRAIAQISDKYYLDALIGLIPTVGDLVSSVLGLPFIYVTLIKLRSIPLTLAVIYNYLVDILLGLLPFFIGDVLDFFKRAHLKNLRLIIGYVDNETDVIREINRKALKTALWIVLLCVAIYFVIKLVGMLTGWLIGLF